MSKIWNLFSAHTASLISSFRSPQESPLSLIAPPRMRFSAGSNRSWLDRLTDTGTVTPYFSFQATICRTAFFQMY